MNKIKVLYTALPFYILVYFFIHFYLDLYLFLSAATVITRLIQYALVTGLLYFAGYRYFLDKLRYILLFSSLLFIFLFYGAIIDTIIYLWPESTLKKSIKSQLFVFSGICTLVIVLLLRAGNNAVVRFLMFWVLYITILLIYDTTRFFIEEKGERKYLSQKSVNHVIAERKRIPVYLLIFDMYPSDTSLARHMDYNNIKVNSLLKSYGFFVAGNSRSQYDATYYSLASTLNLSKLEYVQDISLAGYKKPLIAFKSMETAGIPLLFQGSGYTVNNFSVFNLLNKKSPLQWNFNEHISNSFTASVLINRINSVFDPDFFEYSSGINLGWLKQSWSSKARADLSLLRIEMDNLLIKKGSAGMPAFNYFHYPMPHPPILFDSAGRAKEFRDMFSHGGFYKARENFISYVKFTNAEIEKIVKSIFDKAGKDVVIIIQGDHGYREFPDKFPPGMRHAIFNAVYLPGNNYHGFNDVMDPIETFEKILINQFGLRLR